MGLLDQLTGALGGVVGQGKGGGANAMLLQGLVSMLGKPGALGTLTSAFQSNGLGNVLQSWVGTGDNLPISPDQLRGVLGSGTVTELASKAGMDENDAASSLSTMLPQVIDKLTPDGKVPSQNDLGGLASSLGKLLH